MKPKPPPIDKHKDYIAALVQLGKQGVLGVNGMSIQEAIERAKCPPEPPHGW